MNLYQVVGDSLKIIYSNERNDLIDSPVPTTTPALFAKWLNETIFRGFQSNICITIDDSAA